jgi:hypothetical protein
MGFFKNVFGNASKRDATDFPPEVARIFEKLHRFLNNESMQNAVLPI